jgi:hypothetical protein
MRRGGVRPHPRSGAALRGGEVRESRRADAEASPRLRGPAAGAGASPRGARVAAFGLFALSGTADSAERRGRELQESR